jgi:hypothetical protein
VPLADATVGRAAPSFWLGVKDLAIFAGILLLSSPSALRLGGGAFWVPPFVAVGFGRAGRAAREVTGGLAPVGVEVDDGSSPMEARIELRYCMESEYCESERARDGCTYIHSGRTGSYGHAPWFAMARMIILWRKEDCGMVLYGGVEEWRATGTGHATITLLSLIDVYLKS